MQLSDLKYPPRYEGAIPELSQQDMQALQNLDLNKAAIIKDGAGRELGIVLDVVYAVEEWVYKDKIVQTENAEVNRFLQDREAAQSAVHAFYKSIRKLDTRLNWKVKLIFNPYEWKQLCEALPEMAMWEKYSWGIWNCQFVPLVEFATEFNAGKYTNPPVEHYKDYGPRDTEVLQYKRRVPEMKQYEW